MIHYHGAPLSGDNLVQIRGLTAKHAMVSFATSYPINTVAEICQSFCIDNGAFTAWKKGGEIDLDGYSAFISKWSRHPAFDFYVIPDVIEGSVDENRKIADEWVERHPDALMKGAIVWHLHEPLEVLREYCETYQRVCIGSSAEFSVIGTTSWWSRMADAMSAACDAEGFPLAKLHGLRMLDPQIFSQFPFSSADSTNVARNIGVDSAWNASYAPVTRECRALIMCERIESQSSASNWSGAHVGAVSNLDLFP